MISRRRDEHALAPLIPDIVGIRQSARVCLSPAEIRRLPLAAYLGGSARGDDVSAVLQERYSRVVVVRSRPWLMHRRLDSAIEAIKADRPRRRAFQNADPDEN